jgi:site-specific recombinase XerD
MLFVGERAVLYLLGKELCVIFYVSYNVGMPKTTFEKYLQQFLEYIEIERGRSHRTVRNYDFYLTRFGTWADFPDPSVISQDMVHQFRLHLNRDIEGRDELTLKKSTQNYHFIALRSFLKYLAKIDVETLSPQKIELAKQGTRKVEFLEQEELAQLFGAARKRGGLIGMRDQAILELLFSTGMRVSELARLLIEDINLKRDEFTVKGKGSKHRIVFLSEGARDALANYLEGRKDLSPHLFISHDRAKNGREAGPFSSRSVQRIVERHAIAAGITKKITPHTIRHTFATDLLRNGADIRSVQSMLGHESITTTQLYTHVTDRQLGKIHKEFHGKG